MVNTHHVYGVLITYNIKFILAIKMLPFSSGFFVL